MPPESNKELSQIIAKIPIFKGLAPSQVQKLFRLFSRESLQPKHILCKAGSPSTDMSVLIGGELAIVLEDGTKVALLTPITTVGEMGLIMRQPRTATVEVVTKSHVLTIQKNYFDALMREDVDMQVRVYRNILEIMAQRLVDDNVRTRDYVREKAGYMKEVKEKSRRAEVAIDLLVKHGGMAREAAEQHIADALQGETLVILVVDDEPVIRAFLKQTLSSFKVLEASNGLEALEIVRNEQPDLIITDIQMPEMDGISLLNELRKGDWNMPVLALSGYMSEQEMSEHDFDGIILKPVNPTEFRKIVEDSLLDKDGDG